MADVCTSLVQRTHGYVTPKPCLAPTEWVITQVNNSKALKLWFDDGPEVVNVIRGGLNSSARLMVESQGFLDITIAGARAFGFIDFNDKRSVMMAPLCRAGVGSDTVSQVVLSLPGDGSFTATVSLQNSGPPALTPHMVPSTISGTFKTFPSVLAEDVVFIQKMIAQKYVPYPNIPDEPGKTDAEIRALGQRLFPWSPYNYELAMSVYDWTTASFTRMVLMNVFQYTSITGTPLDDASVALMIWESNWGSYTPSNADYMRSFMMTPADSEANVQQQLSTVSSDLQRFSAVENRLVAAAVQSLPRTCILAQPYLFSGQVDIYQMGMSRFGVEMLEFPGNAGPVGKDMEVEFATAVATFIEPSSTITTKMSWSFTDTEADALHYANGILLVVEPPADSDSFVWGVTAYITPLSDGPTKTEYVFPPGSRFLVLSVEPYSAQSSVQVVRLQVIAPDHIDAVATLDDAAREHLALCKSQLLQERPSFDALGDAEERVRDVAVAQAAKTIFPDLDQISKGEEPKMDHVEARKTNGRWCRCVERH
ncbi:hypothetical protein BDZ89DRAFT_983492 [Hymenopellis radicata]|nr:hypothetical protein BDZ89DRAFT_983492 [Hymenopellis radicata]